MGIKRHKPEEIVSKPRQVDVLVGQGMARVDAVREVGITEQTYYRWRKQFARLEPLLPTGTRGKPRVDDCWVISGIIHVLKTVCRRADAPEVYGPRKTY